MSAKTTYKQTELGLIPEDWEVKKLGEIGKIINGLTYSPENIKENGTLVLRSSNVQNNRIVYDDNVFVEENLSFNPTQKGDVLICVRNGSRNLIGKTAQIDDQSSNVAFGAFMTIYRSNKNNFIYNYFKSDNFFREVHRNLGATINSINNNDLKKFKIPLPPLPEQKAIADCLSTWDVAIEKQSQLIETLTQRKKALMQQLLTGKKRLPGFSEEWKEVKLGDIGKTYNGLTGKTKEDFGEGEPFITYMNIFSNSKIDISNFEYVKIGVNENQNKTIYGDIFFTVSSETPDEVGMASVLLDRVDNLYLNSFCFGFRLNDLKSLLPEFSSYLFRNDLFRKEVYKLAQGSTRFNLSKLELMKIKIKLPSLSEQTAIAEILATADRELQLQKEKLAQLQTQKKGLMQVLLTGKKRLIN